MKLKRNLALLTACGTTAGSWVSVDENWLFINRCNGTKGWVIYPLHDGANDYELLYADLDSTFDDFDPDDPSTPEGFLAKNGLDILFASRRQAVEALTLALEGVK
jgi:hypothetical protein